MSNELGIYLVTMVSSIKGMILPVCDGLSLLKNQASSPVTLMSTFFVVVCFGGGGGYKLGTISMTYTESLLFFGQ